MPSGLPTGAIDGWVNRLYPPLAVREKLAALLRQFMAAHSAEDAIQSDPPETALDLTKELYLGLDDRIEQIIKAAYAAGFGRNPHN